MSPISVSHDDTEGVTTVAIKKVTHSRGTSYEVTAKINGRTHRKRFGTKSAALDHQAQIRTQARDGSYVHPAVSKITFGEYSAQWLAGLQVRETTLVSYERNLRNHLLPVFGPVRLRALTRTQVQEFITALSQGPLAPATQRAVINLLRIVLRAAVHDGRLATSPCYKLRLPEVPPKQLAVFTPEQAATLLATATPRDYAVLATALGTGLRQGELLGLITDVVDLDAGVLHVRQQLRSPVGRGRPTLSPLLKTSASRRTLALPPFVVEALRLHLARYGVGEGGLLFPNPAGTGWRRGSFNDSVWKPALRRAGLPLGFGLHATRHTFACGLIRAGHHVKEVQEALGHASPEETYRTYLHVWPGHQQRVAASIQTLFGPAKPGLRSVG
jgi:integrase